jgi:predicted RNA polymerase sigma factor
MRGPGESYSDVILRLVKVAGAAMTWLLCLLAALRNYAPLPAARGDFLFRAGRPAEARSEFEAAAKRTRNVRKGPFSLLAQTLVIDSIDLCV